MATQNCITYERYCRAKNTPQVSPMERGGSLHKASEDDLFHTGWERVYTDQIGAGVNSNAGEFSSPITGQPHSIQVAQIQLLQDLRNCSASAHGS